MYDVRVHDEIFIINYFSNKKQCSITSSFIYITKYMDIKSNR